MQVSWPDVARQLDAFGNLVYLLTTDQDRHNWKYMEVPYPSFGFHKNMILHIFAGFIVGHTGLPHGLITAKQDTELTKDIN